MPKLSSITPLSSGKEEDIPEEQIVYRPFNIPILTKMRLDLKSKHTYC
jgi:hypothetical protein